MTHESMQAMEQGMFWVGALFVFMPILFASVVIGVWWFQKRRATTTARNGDGALRQERATATTRNSIGSGLVGDDS